jgi:peptidoglycan biosynthesis protein MviN/MurJ (putative lipid II flippase)
VADPGQRVTLARVEAEHGEGRVEGWARRTRFTAVVVLFVVSLALVLALPGVARWLSGVLMAVAVLWYWLPVVLRSRRTFGEGYRSQP